MFETQVKSVQIPERQKLHILYDRYRHQYENMLRKLVRRINKILVHSNINYTIKYRLKAFDSFFEKLVQLRDAGNQPVNITDFLGIRIISPFLEDLDLVENLLNREFKILEVERKNEKNSFREFSYDSIHLLIDIPDKPENGFIPFVSRVCEIQLRTILQDAWAEVEHELIYKANFSLLNEPIKRKLASLNASLTLSDIIFQEIRDYQKEIESRRKKCRNSIDEKLDIGNGISILSGIENNQKIEQYVSADPVQFKPKSQLEKLLFDALEEHSKNEFERAIEIYSSILRMKPKPHVRSIVYNHRGMAYFALAEYIKSIKDFTRALEYNAKNTRILNNRGLAFRMIKNFENALKDLDRSLELNEYLSETYHLRALIFSDLNDSVKAIENCNKALDIKPDYEPAIHLKTLLVSKL